MRVSPRLWIPAVAAIGVCVILLAVLAWQLRDARGLFADALPTPAPSSVASEGTSSPSSVPALVGADEALGAMHQGDVAVLAGNWNTARTEYERAVTAGGGVAALRKLAQAQLHLRDTQGARETLDRLRKEGAAPQDVLLIESILLVRTGEIERARALLASAPDSPQRSYASALLAIMEGRHDDAVTALNATAAGWEPVLRSYARALLDAYNAYASFPDSPPIHRDTLVARALAEVRECDTALRLLEPVVEQRDDYRDAWIVRGYCQLGTGDTSAAILSLERAYQLDPSKPETQYLLGRAYRDAGDPAQALTFFQYALRNGFAPASDVRRMIAEQAEALENPLLALEQYRALLQEPDATPADVMLFVDAALSADRTDEALQAATQATERFPADAAAYELLGRTAAKAGQIDSARSALRHALELEPSRTSAQNALDDL